MTNDRFNDTTKEVYISTLDDGGSRYCATWRNRKEKYQPRV